MIRKHPNAACWSWAIEFNKNYRVVGFFGSREATQEIFDTFEKLKVAAMKTTDGSFLHYRYDVKLQKEEDVLFEWVLDED